MAKRRHGTQRFAQVQGNLTPMIDLSFLLIVFFVLVSKIIDTESVEMQLPQPMEADTLAVSDDVRTIINVMPGIDGRAQGYRVGGASFTADAAGALAMREYLADALRRNPALNVHLRADRSTHYEDVQPAMEALAAAAAAAGIQGSRARINLIVERDEP